MTAIRIGAVWSAPTWVRKAAMPARAGGLQDQHHHDHRAGEQSTVGAGEADQGVHLGVLVAERPSPGEPGAGPAAHGARAFSGPRLAPPISDTAETAAIPGTSPGSTCSLFRSATGRGSARAGASGGAAADHDTGRRGDRHPPPGRIGSITWLTHQRTQLRRLPPAVTGSGVITRSGTRRGRGPERGYCRIWSGSVRIHFRGRDLAPTLPNMTAPGAGEASSDRPGATPSRRQLGTSDGSGGRRHGGGRSSTRRPRGGRRG